VKRATKSFGNSEKGGWHLVTTYYELNADEFEASTLALDMEALYAPFLAHVPPGGEILDAGCGVGRDVRNFARKGFRVTAFDASEAMAERARANSGQDVLTMGFQDVAWTSAFDGIWCCASLLHVPRREMDAVIQKLVRALKAHGVMYVSFKYGTTEGARNGRHFTDYDEALFQALLSGHPALREVSRWVTSDLRPGREGEKWLNAVVRRE
jgi:2-polyprenyl-3-methyl-5-hydroxy-6-metoxy-1,4-benzoquinol methylase